MTRAPRWQISSDYTAGVHLLDALADALQTARQRHYHAAFQTDTPAGLIHIGDVKSRLYRN